MNFGEALQALKDGKKVTRSIWGGYWYIANNVELTHDNIPAKKGDTIESYDGCTINTLILASLRDNGGIAPAQPYQSDLLAEDWQIVE